MSAGIPDDGHRISDAAVQAVIQTTQIDHERRIAALEERYERQRESFEEKNEALWTHMNAKFDTFGRNVDEKFEKISSQYQKAILWSAGAALSLSAVFVTLLAEIFTRK